ncbi:MAG: flagellin, partial [Pseudomonadota bacterium]
MIEGRSLVTERGSGRFWPFHFWPPLAVTRQLVAAAQQNLSASNNLNQITNPPENLNQNIGNNILLDVEATLNVRIGARYIFAGTNYESVPVTDLRQLPELAPAVSNTPATTDPTIETTPNLPTFTINNVAVSYSTIFDAAATPPVTADSNSHAQAQIAVNDQRNLRYGVTANEEAIQNLIHAALRLRASGQPEAGTTPITLAQRREFLTTARTLAETALNQLRDLQVTISQNLADFEVHRQAHIDTNLILEDSLARIYNVDVNVAATQMASLQTQIQASYSVIGRQNELSLLNFLRQ